MDERIAALEDAQANAPAVVSGSIDTSPMSVDVVALEERLAAADEHLAAADERAAAMDERVAALEDAAESVDQSSPTQGVTPHDHLTSPVSTFPHVWTRAGNPSRRSSFRCTWRKACGTSSSKRRVSATCRHVPDLVIASPVLLVRDVAEESVRQPRRSRIRHGVV